MNRVKTFYDTILLSAFTSDSSQRTPYHTQMKNDNVCPIFRRTCVYFCITLINWYILRCVHMSCIIIRATQGP